MALDVAAIVRTHLKSYLDTELAARGVVCTVYDDWPKPGVDLPERAVSITAPEEEVSIVYWPPEPFELIPDSNDPGEVSGRAQYTYGEFKLPVQLDVWTRYATTRKEMARLLTTLLFRHPNQTLANDTWPRLGRWPELVLPAPTDLPGALIFYRFGEVPLPVEDGALVQEGEFRLRIPGEIQGFLTSEEAVAILRDLTVTLNDDDFTASP